MGFDRGHMNTFSLNGLFIFQFRKKWQRLRKRVPPLKVKRMEELVQSRAGILNVIRDINLPVRVAGEIRFSSLCLNQLQLLSIYSGMKSKWLK